MKDRLRNLIAIAIATAAAVGIALTVGGQRGSAANTVFQPPPGWHKTQNLGRGLGVWLHPSDGQSITVSATQFTGSLSDFTQMQLAQISQLPNAKIGAAQRTTVCGSHPSAYITYAAVENNKAYIDEQMLAVWAGVGYLATYSRSAGQRAFYDARNSLTTLCGGLPIGHSMQSTQPVTTPLPIPTPYLGSTQAPQPLGTAEPTVTPTYGP